MTLYALASAGGAPGVTTTALALALSWPSRVIIAECDPAGGDILAGLLGGELPGRTGLLPLAMEAGRSTDAVAAALWRQLIDLDPERGRLLLAGLTDPRQAAALEPSWPAIAAALATVPADVLADCGRVDAAPAVAPVLAAASVAVLVIRPTLRHVARARQRAELLTGLLGGPGRLVVLLAGEGQYTAREVHSALGLPVAGTLPADRKTAAMLSDGTGGRRGLSRRPLVRAAAEAGLLLRAAAVMAAGGKQRYRAAQHAEGRSAAIPSADGRRAGGVGATLPPGVHSAGAQCGSWLPNGGLHGAPLPGGRSGAAPPGSRLRDVAPADQSGPAGPGAGP